MRIVTLAVLVAASIAGTALAQPASFGDVFPLSNTRYGPVHGGAPLLRANGRDFFLFWPAAENKIRATRLRDGETRIGHAVLDDVSYDFDVVWTGAHFLVFADRQNADGIVARKLDANAQPLGESFTVTEDGWLPRAAASDETILMLYRPRSSESYRSLLLDLGGRPKSGNLSAESFAGYTAVASNGSTFLVATASHEAVRTTLFDRNGGILSDRTAAENLHQTCGVSVAVGAEYLVVPCGVWTIRATPVNANGAAGAPLTIAQLNLTNASQGAFRSVAATWNGAGWTVAYEHSFDPVRFAHIDASGQGVVARDELDPGTRNPTIAALGGRIKSAWSPPNNASGHAAMVADLPLAAAEARATTYAAAQQLLVATASSDEATLIVWRERSDGLPRLRAGIRKADGQWRERDLGPVRTNDYVFAASDGEGFLVAVDRPELIDAFFLDGNARLLRTVTSTALSWLRGVVSNGRDYVLAGYGDGFKGIVLKNDGASAQTVTLPPVGSADFAIASDGTGYVMTWPETYCGNFMICRSTGMRATRIGADFTRIDASDLVLADVLEGLQIDNLGIVWDGSRYVAAWTENTIDGVKFEGTVLARIPSSPQSSVETRNLGKSTGNNGSIASTRAGVAIVGRSADESGAPVSRITFLRNDGGIARSVDIDRGATLTARPLLAAHGDAVAYIASSVQNDAPHHGTSHVTMALTTSSVAPGRPQVTARIDENGVVTIAWTAPAGVVNGYRLEYRIDDGSWIELESWFETGEQQTAIRVSTSVRRMAVRVRAFNDGGAGDYSEAAYVNAGRRRAVR